MFWTTFYLKQRKFRVSRMQFLPTTREGNVFTGVCLPTGVFLFGLRPPGQRPPWTETPLDKDTWTEGTRQEVTSYTPGKNIGPDRKWHHTPSCYWYLVAATTTVGTHLTGMHWSYLASLVFGKNCRKIGVNTSGPKSIKWWHHQCVSHKVMTSPMSVKSEINDGTWRAFEFEGAAWNSLGKWK